jgi:hypothetical protein
MGGYDRSAASASFPGLGLLHFVRVRGPNLSCPGLASQITFTLLELVDVPLRAPRAADASAPGIQIAMTGRMIGDVVVQWGHTNLSEMSRAHNFEKCPDEFVVENKSRQQGCSRRGASDKTFRRQPAPAM